MHAVFELTFDHSCRNLATKVQLAEVPASSRTPRPSNAMLLARSASVDPSGSFSPQEHVVDRLGERKADRNLAQPGTLSDPMVDQPRQVDVLAQRQGGKMNLVAELCQHPA